VRRRGLAADSGEDEVHVDVAVMDAGWNRQVRAALS
jgi:hypothetical protein